MSLKKLLPLMGTALALAAFTLPASAPASQWRDAGKPIEGSHVISATGTYQLTTALGGIHCKEVTAEFWVRNNGGVAEGDFIGWHENGILCHGSGALEGCSTSVSELTFIPWLEVDSKNSGSMIIRNGILWLSQRDTDLKSECGVEEIELDFLSVNGDHLTMSFDRNGSGGIEGITITAPNGGILTAFGLEVAGVELEADLAVGLGSSGTYQLS